MRTAVTSNLKRKRKDRFSKEKIVENLQQRLQPFSLSRRERTNRLLQEIQENKFPQTTDLCSVDPSSKWLICMAQIKRCERVRSVHIALMLETSEPNNSESRQQVGKVL